MLLLFIIQPKLYLLCAEHTVHIIQNTGTVLSYLICLIKLRHLEKLFFHTRREYIKLQHTIQTTIVQ